MLVYINWGCMFFSRFIIMNSYQKLRTSHQLQLATPTSTITDLTDF